MTANIWLWIGFNAFVLIMLALDLGVFHRKAHVVTFKESIAWTVAWITLALKIGLGGVLSFVGVKMLLAHSAWKIDTHISLGVIVLVLAASVVASLVWPKNSRC